MLSIAFLTLSAECSVSYAVCWMWRCAEGSMSYTVVIIGELTVKRDAYDWYVL